jgi:DNA invertase Pin-like site-specific DNA recombinase
VEDENMRCALYARVSTTDQTAKNQIHELRRYADARGWTICTEYVDHGVSGSKQSRPQLDAMLRDAKRRQFDAIAIWSLDRLGRDLKHLIVLLDDLHSLGVSLVSLREGLDWSTPSGRLQAQLLGMIAEFERSRIQERVRRVSSAPRSKARGF